MFDHIVSKLLRARFDLKITLFRDLNITLFRNVWYGVLNINTFLSFTTRLWKKNVWGIAEDRIRAHDKTGGASRQLLQNHRGQTKRHSLWFSTKSCRCYATNNYVNCVILILKLNLTPMRNIYITIGLRWAPHTFFTSKSNSIWQRGA